MPTLEAQSIAVRYGQLEAVHDVSLRIGDGEIVALVGSNGAGKSTTLKALMGLKTLARGDLRWDGQSIAAMPAAGRVARGIALSPEGRRLFPRMTVMDNLELGAYTTRSVATRRRTLDMIYGLFPRVHERRGQMAGSLSGGEQQMVAIGRALMAQPKLLLLDEPSLGLAPKVIAEIAQAVEQLNRETGLSIVLVEQNARLAMRLSHRAYVLERGEVVRTGTGQELLEDDFVRQAYLGV
ncbi:MULTISPECIES: ABC transporter ATP-binding protein [Achromobacter]|uniref:High-affinity branched-chain amino acid transport ATP-binding protein LivF n=1 Tax=Achromobacter piechaudii TaxID=72556 RepID=A0A6S7C264_9BURK|nr:MULTISPECIES: ABC transporter ATP-binding protein [Achromobacter]MPS78570.1 ABC transporter ATP-binding protein [Achromobacter sp.]CAB3827443.1 High-affinity branched-chain amino acid transport ATP-binding protein LivF [Achromobacter piechaudii]